MNKEIELIIQKRKAAYEKLREQSVAIDERNDEIHDGLAFVRRRLASTESGTEEDVWLDALGIILKERAEMKITIHTYECLVENALNSLNYELEVALNEVQDA